MPWPCYLGSAEKDDLNAELKRLAEYLIDRNLILFCGSGLSKKSKMPLFKEIAEFIICDLLKLDPAKDASAISQINQKYPPEAIAAAYAEGADRTALNNFINKAFDSSTATIHPGLTAIGTFATQQYINRIYTTNYDDLLEKAIGGQAVPIIDSSVHEFDKHLNKGGVAVIHLHGIVNGEIRITESETYALETPLAQLLKGEIVRNRFLFVGYTMNDYDLKNLYFYMLSLMQRFGPNRTMYVALPVDSSEEWRIARRVWKTRNAILLPARAEDFLPALEKRIDEIRIGPPLRYLKEKVGKSDSDVLKEIELILKEHPGYGRTQAIKAYFKKEGLDWEDADVDSGE